MFFSVVRTMYAVHHPNTVHLVEDDWNDWFEWQTMYTLVVYDATNEQHVIGSVKIAHQGMQPLGPNVLTRTPLPQTFNALSEDFFSVGQDDDYYEALFALEASLRERIVKGLRDMAADPTILPAVRREPVVMQSLLRNLFEDKITGRFRRLLHGDATLTRFDFKFSYPPPSDSVQLEFEVVPESQPPTNIHVLIGRNGVGKTRLLQQISLGLLSGDDSYPGLGSFVGVKPFPLLDPTETPAHELFGNLVSVTFSAFDPFFPLSETKKEPLSLPYSYVGLKKQTAPISQAVSMLLDKVAGNSMMGVVTHKADPGTKSFGDLTDDFADSVSRLIGPKFGRWRRALGLLESDPLFEEARIKDLADIEDERDLDDAARNVFWRLSSGHKIVLLTITRLVQTVEEKTLVLMDEPEAHLHPPLLAAFIRSLSDLLIQRNGVALIATHSPVVLQEAPRKCVWVLRRVGESVEANRPELETFGENVGILTRSVFGLEVVESGFHAILTELIENGASYDELLATFDEQLGAEARSIARALIAEREKD